MELEVIKNAAWDWFLELPHPSSIRGDSWVIVKHTVKMINSICFICSKFMLALHLNCCFLSINPIPHMQAYPLWVTEGYLHACVPSLFVYTVLSKERSRVSKPLWHTKYCCGEVFFSHRQCGRVSEHQHYSHNVTKICVYLERWHLHPPTDLLVLNTYRHTRTHIGTHTFLKSVFHIFFILYL